MTGIPPRGAGYTGKSDQTRQSPPKPPKGAAGVGDATRAPRDTPLLGISIGRHDIFAT